MYKNPQASDQAKRLREIVTTFGLQLSHSQALEVIARLQGHRTLHVAQARKNAGVDILATARAQAAALMFDDYGPFLGNPQGLHEALAELHRMNEQGRKADLEMRFRELFFGTSAIRMLPPYDSIAAEKLSPVFDTLAQKLAAVLAQVAEAPVPVEETRYKGAMPDYRVADGQSVLQLPEWQRQPYVVELVRQGHQVRFDILPEGAEELEGQPQLQAIVEVGEGVPCIHLSNTVYGDTVLTIYATADGLYLAPGATDLSICTGQPAQSSLGLVQLRKDLEVCYTPAQVPRMTGNHAFIEAYNG